MRWINSDGCTPSTSANFTTVRTVGLRRPRSNRLMKVRSNPASKPKPSWENPCSLRVRCRACPNARSGPAGG
jgi:hypothetical protein